MKLFSLFTFVVLVIVALIGSGLQAASVKEAPGTHVTVNTPLGPITGFVNEYGGYSFLGVRFARPPIGDLRFKSPQDLAPWTEPQNATYLKAGCIQDCPGGRFAKLMCPTTISEDCLYLNIFTPSLNKDAKLPQNCFFHGGMTTWGSSQIPLYDEALWSTQNNFIGIAANYRLNIFGGLMTNSLEGNFHTQDQIQALKFIHTVISSFGGNPGNLKIMGQSSGATAVGVLLTAPAAWPYFNGAVILSDPVGFTLASKKMAIELGETCALKLGCPFGNTSTAKEEQLACLQSKSTEELLKTSKTSYLPTPNEVLSVILQWQPSIDEHLVVGDPIAMFEAGKFHKVPLFISNVANETSIFVDSLKIDAKTWMLDLALDYIFGFTDAATVEKLYGPIPSNYTGGGIEFFSRILTDYTFACPMKHIADIASDQGMNVHYGFYDIIENWVPWYLNSTTDPCAAYEVCHAFDLPNYFYDGYQSLPKDFPHLTPDEMKLSQFMQRSVGAFVRGNFDQLSGMGFPAWNTTTRNMYNFSVPLPTAPMSNYRHEQCAMWNKIGWNRH